MNSTTNMHTLAVVKSMPTSSLFFMRSRGRMIVLLPIPAKAPETNVLVDWGPCCGNHNTNGNYRRATGHTYTMLSTSSEWM